MLGKKRNLKKISKTEPSFLSKLYKILNTKEYNPYIHWSNDGLSVIISDPAGLTKKVLPKYYNHHNFASFVRQLNMYNFHKIRTDPKSNEQNYIHNEFFKGKSLKEIQEIRRKIKIDDDKDKNKNKNKILIDKKINTGINLDNNIINDKTKLILDDIDDMDDGEKLIKYQNLIKNGQMSFSNSGDKIFSFLLDKLKQSEENHKNIENEISNLIKQNNILLQQLQTCNSKLASQKDFCQKMKGLVIFLVTLVMRKNQNYKICKIDIGGGKDNNNNNKKIKNFPDFVFKYLNYHKNKINTNNIKIGNESNKENNIQTTNSISIGNNIKKQNNLVPIIQKGENFTINQNDLLENLKTFSNNNDESFMNMNNNDLSMSFSKNFNMDLDLKKANSFSSANLFNNSIFFQLKK